MSSVYFRGIYFNQNFKNIQDGVEFINTMLGEIPYHKDTIKILIQDKSIYFRTYNFDEPDKIYSRLKLDSGGIPNKYLYLYHFFDIDEIEDKHFKMYALISNIENYKRLLISFAYILSPNLPYSHKKNHDEKMYVENGTISNYSKSLKCDTKISYHELFTGSSLESIYNQDIDSYNKIKNIYEAINHDKKDYVNDIRVAIAHNCFNLTKWQTMISYDDDIQKLIDISLKLEQQVEKITQEYSNKCEACKATINISSILTCTECNKYLGHNFDDGTKCCDESEYKICAGCEKPICIDCYEKNMPIDCDEIYCSFCINKFFIKSSISGKAIDITDEYN